MEGRREEEGGVRTSILKARSFVRGRYSLGNTKPFSSANERKSKKYLAYMLDGTLT